MPRPRRQWSVLRAAVRTLLREDTAAASYWTDALLLDLFNDNMDRWYLELSEAFEGWVSDAFITDLVASQGEYLIQEGIGRIKRVLLRFPDVPSERELIRDERIGGGVRHSSGGAVGDLGGSDPSYRVLGDLILLEPRPTVSRAGGLKVEFDYVPDRIVLDTDKLDRRLPDAMETLLIYDTATSALAVEGAQGNIDPRAADHILRLRNEYLAAFREFIAVRSHGPVYGRPYYLGD